MAHLPLPLIPGLGATSVFNLNAGSGGPDDALSAAAGVLLGPSVLTSGSKTLPCVTHSASGGKCCLAIHACERRRPVNSGHICVHLSPVRRTY